MRKFFGSLIVIVTLLTLGGSSLTARDFNKITYLDPYTYLVNLEEWGSWDTTGTSPETYFAQMDSLGITLCVGRADSRATANPYGPKMLGQYGMREFYSRPLDYYTHISDMVYAEAENTDVENGYWWTFTGGQPYPEDEPYTGHIFEKGYDTADTVMVSHGVKFGWRMSGWSTQARIRVAAWTDTLASDTVCDLIVEHLDPNNGYNVDVYSYTGVDFQGVPRGEWKTFTTSNFGVREWSFVTVKLFWRGNDSLAVDQIVVSDLPARIYEGISSETMDTVISEYYSTIDTSGQARFYPCDEPRASQLWGLERFDDHVSAIPPYHRVTTTHRYHVGPYIHDIHPLEVNYDEYVIMSDCDSATTTSLTAPKSIQSAYDQLIAKLAPYADTVLSNDLTFWFAIQAGFIGEAQRNPTPNEIKAQFYLTLLYGVSGVGFFPYCELWGGGGNPPDKSVPILACSAGDTLLAPSQQIEPDFGGLVDFNFSTNRFEPNQRWYAAKECIDYTDSIWPTFGELTWQGADDWKGISSLPSSIIDSVYSVTFPADSTYLQVATFTSEDDDVYYAFLNRRSLSSDSQDVVFRLDDCPGGVRLYDLYRDSTYCEYDSSGVVRFAAHFAPAELRVFKIEHSERLKGSWTGTWSEFSTIDVVGDITVPQGQTLEIENPEITIAANVDSLSSGADANKIDLIVAGELHIESGQGDRIVLDSEDGTDSSWYGIGVTGGGKLYLDDVVIKNAYAGVTTHLTMQDTVVNCRFENCFMYGVYCNFASAYLCRDTFYVPESDTSAGYGVFVSGNVDSASTIKNCYFKDIKYPVVGVYYSDLNVDSCYFYRSDLPSYGQTPAVYAVLGPDVTVTNSTINDCAIGVGMGMINCHVTIDSCNFTSENSPGSYFIFTAIDGTAGSNSTCKVRNSCFQAADDAHVYNYAVSFDLGTSQDPGNNYFHTERYYYHDILVNKPDLLIQNDDSDTVLAVGNTWYAYRNATWFDGPVDSSGATLDANYDCLVFGPPFKQVAEENVVKEEALPLTYSLGQNYPNPFNPSTVISYSIAEAGPVRIEVFNVLGQRVRLLLDRALAAGSYEVMWNSIDDQGNAVSSGVYLYRITAGDFVASRKMILIK